MFGAIEAGGTKFVCAVGTGPEDLQARVELPTTTPDETLRRVIAFFEGEARREPLAAIGIGCFGPLDLDPASPRFGFITATPKPGWQNVDLAGVVGRALRIPVMLDTDVNAAALGEHLWGAAQGLRSFVYVTVGTGIGGGGMLEGKLMHGLLHPEMGHIRLPHDLRADPFPGICPFHGDCWEGLASGKAVEARWGSRGERLPRDHAAWPLEAHYLALGVANLVCTLSPQRVVLGGGVMRQASLFPLIRQKVVELLNAYIQVEAILTRADQYIVPPGSGDSSGILGGIALAREAVRA